MATADIPVPGCTRANFSLELHRDPMCRSDSTCVRPLQCLRLQGICKSFCAARLYILRALHPIIARSLMPAMQLDLSDSNYKALQYSAQWARKCQGDEDGQPVHAFIH